MRIEIKYYVDSDKFTQEEFEAEPQRSFVIDKNKLSVILRTYGDLNADETIHKLEFELKK